VSSCDTEERDVSFEGGVEEIGGKRDTLAHNWKVHALSGCGIGACWPRARSLDYIKVFTFPTSWAFLLFPLFPPLLLKKLQPEHPIKMVYPLDYFQHRRDW